MVTIFVASTETAGKTAVCSALGRKLLELGKRVGYFKPVTVTASGSPDFDDCAALNDSLELNLKDMAGLCPFHLTKSQLAEYVGARAAEFDSKVKPAFVAASSGRDAMVVEGLTAADDAASKANAHLAEILDARVILVAAYVAGMTASKAAASAKTFGPRFLGAVITGVPKARLAGFAADAKTAWAKDGVRVLGVLPEDRTLYGLTVAEIVRLLDAKVLADGRLDGVVENVMLGALTPDSGLNYFGRKDNKAAVIRSDRADMALAAIQTRTAALVLTGGAEPEAIVTITAEKRRVPVLLVKTTMDETVAAIEKALPQARFRGPRKFDRMDELMAKNFDFAVLLKDLGL